MPKINTAVEALASLYNELQSGSGEIGAVIAVQKDGSIRAFIGHPGFSFNFHRQPGASLSAASESTEGHIILTDASGKIVIDACAGPHGPGGGPED